MFFKLVCKCTNNFLMTLFLLSFFFSFFFNDTATTEIYTLSLHDALPIFTLLFTDIEGSTRLLDALGPAYAEALAEHRRHVRAAVAERGGVEVDTQGDAFLCAFQSARDAVLAATAAQTVLAQTPVRVRIGVHTGEPALTDEGYVGLDVHRGARICAAAHGGQILVSSTTRDLLDGSVELRDLGAHRLKDLAEPQRLYQVVSPALEQNFAPPLSETAPSNLPRPSSPLVGRREEISSLVQLVREGTRLVTLTGPGGAGKKIGRA